MESALNSCRLGHLGSHVVRLGSGRRPTIAVHTPWPPLRPPPGSGGGTLIGLGLLFAWLPLAMVVSNVLVATVAPARRTLDREAQAVPGTDLVSANTRLLKVMLVITPTGLFLAILGILAV